VLNLLLHRGDLTLLSATGWIDLAIWVALLGVKIFALVDSLRWSNQHYVSAGKRNRTIWLVLTGASLAFHLLASTSVGLLTIAGDIASIVYLVDVRPALQQVSGRGGNRNNMGPYGPW
jgi:Protein of unknown function (DUF2516)